MRMAQTEPSEKRILQKSDDKNMATHSSPESDGSQFRYIQQNRTCWRCRKKFPVLIAPYELDPVLLFRCDHKGDYRYLLLDDADQIAAQQSGSTRASATSRPVSPITQKQFEIYLKEFLKTTKCACGGRYHFSAKTPVKCPQCGAWSFTWWPWPEEVVALSNIPKLAT